MADYGSKKFYEEQAASCEVELKMMLRGFASIVTEEKYADVIDFAPYIDRLSSTMNSLEYNLNRIKELEESEGDKE